MRMFLYGTLRVGQQYHRLLDDRSPLATLRTEPAYTLLDLGGYPGMLAGGQTAVVGELYDVDLHTLGRLDILEEVPNLYRRVPAVVEGHGVQLYLLRPEFARGAPIIRSGDWLER